VDCGGYESCKSMQYALASANPDISPGATPKYFQAKCYGEESCAGMTRDSSWETLMDSAASDSSVSMLSIFYCHGYKSCVEAEMQNSWCLGELSCYDMVVDTTETIKCHGNVACIRASVYDNSGDTECLGNNACQSATFYKSDNVYCDGRVSCIEAKIYGPNALYGRGELSLVHAQINSCWGEGCEQSPQETVRDIVIYAQGQSAMIGATLNCFGGSTCDLHCYGDACLAMGGYLCFPGAVCNCDGNGCPMIVTLPGKEKTDELMVFHRAATSEGEDSQISSILSLNEMSGSMMVLVGAMSVVMILMALFYAVRQSEKGEYEPLE